MQLWPYDLWWIFVMRKEVEHMIKNEGIYLAGDVNYPVATVVLVSRGGKIFSTVLDQELDPERFLEQ